MKALLIGHSTVLLESGGTRLLLDPFFGWGNLAYRRLAPPARSRSEIGPVQGVLISHTHFDHFDGRYLRGLPRDVPVYTGAGARPWATLKARRPVRALRIWDAVSIGGLEVTAVPARHLGPTTGFVVRDGDQAAYFAGDTYFGDFMQEIARRCAPQVCFLPVSTFRLPLTMGNVGALKATVVLRPRAVIPIHLGITPRSPLLRRRENAESYRALVESAGLLTEVKLLAPGESCEW